MFMSYCVALAKILRCLVLLLVDVGMEMHIKVIRKRLLHFHMGITWILL